MNDDAKANAHVEMLEMNELLDNLILMNEDLYDMQFEDLTPAIWEAVLAYIPVQTAFLNNLKESLKLASKIVDNDALLAHMEIVRLAD